MEKKKNKNNHTGLFCWIDGNGFFQTVLGVPEPPTARDIAEAHRFDELRKAIEKYNEPFKRK